MSLAKIDSDSVAVCELSLRKIYPSPKYLIYEVNLANDVWNESTLDQSFKASLFRMQALRNTHLKICFLKIVLFFSLLFKIITIAVQQFMGGKVDFHCSKKKISRSNKVKK